MTVAQLRKRAKERLDCLPPWENTSPEGAKQALADLTNDARGMNRFVSPFQGYRAESIRYPGRRSAAVAATLCVRAKIT